MISVTSFDTCTLNFEKPELEFQYFNSLKDSLLFDVFKTSEHSEVKKAARTVWNSLSCNGGYKPGPRKQCLMNVLCNLAISIQQGRSVAVSLNRNDYKTGRRYRLLHFKYDLLVPMLKEMESLRWLHLKIGFYDQARKWGRCTRIWASERMGRLLYGIDPNVHVHDEYHELVILRDSDKMPVDYRDNRFTNGLRKDLRKYNVFMNGVDVRVSTSRVYRDEGTDVWNVPVFIVPKPSQPISPHCAPLPVRVSPSGYPACTSKPTSETNLHTQCQQHTQTHPPIPLLRGIGLNSILNSNLSCIFNRGGTQAGKCFKFGGRFYSSGYNGYQNLPREQRQLITINGNPTAELDFNALHITMLYAEKGIQYNGDPYLAVSDRKELRPILKKVLLVAINAESVDAAVKSINWQVNKLRARKRRESEGLRKRDSDFLESWNRYRPDTRQVIQELKEAHKPIADEFCNDAGVRLMNKDAGIIRDVIMHFINKGIPCLPVHDSVIIERQHKKELARVMEDAYSKHMNGFKCGVSEK